MDSQGRPGSVMATPAKRRFSHSKAGRRTLIGVVSLVVVIGLLTAGTFAYISFRNGQVHHETVSGLVPTATTGPHVGEQTFLLIGSTSRCVLNGKQTSAFGSCAAGVTGVNADVILLLHANPTTHTLTVLSIPRDLALYNVRPGEFHKVDAALANGPSQLVTVIEQDLGIPINHFAELNFDSFQGIVNALGGVSMYFPNRLLDQQSALNIPTPGCHLLNGFQALAVVRSRHLNYWVNGVEQYDGTGDLGRILRVHEFLRVLAATLAKRGLSNPITDNALIGAVAPQLTVDSSLSLTDMVNLVLAFHTVNANNVLETTLPNAEYFANYSYEGYNYGSMVMPSYPQDQQAIDQFLGLKAAPGSNVSPNSVTVSVLDGMNSPATVTTMTSKLSALGYKISGTGTAIAVGPLAETVVYYAPGHLADGERVAQSLHGIVSMSEGTAAQGTLRPGSDVTVVTGSNFAVSNPPAAAHSAPTTSSTHGSSKSSSSGSSIPNGASQPNLAPTSSAVQSLPSYDPRACPGS